MDKEELIGRLDTPDKTHMVDHCIALVENFEVTVPDLLAISFHKKKELVFRAAWMLEYVMVQHPDKFAPYLLQFLDLLPAQKNHSAMRHYAKIVSLVTDSKARPTYQEFSKTLDFEPTIEVLFTWLVDANTLVASKVHCMQSLANLARRYAWIKDDLSATIDHLVDLESIAFFARAKQVRKQLNKIK